MCPLEKRARETHDIWHVATGYGLDQEGEVGLSAFYVAQMSSPLNAIVLGVAFFIVVFRQPKRMNELMETITRGWTMGKAASPLFAVKWEELWERPLADVRRELRLPIA